LIFAVAEGASASPDEGSGSPSTSSQQGGTGPVTEKPSVPPFHIVEEGVVEKPSRIPYRGLAVVLLVLLIIATFIVLSRMVKPPAGWQPPEE